MHFSNYPQKSFNHAVVAVDVAIITIDQGGLKIVLLELKEPPYTGKWALPGGLVRTSESTDSAALRHLIEKAGVSDVFLEQLYTFSDPSRDPNGRVVSVAYYSLVNYEKLHLQTTPRYADIQLHPIDSLPSLAYDHSQIISTAINRLRSKIGYTNAVYSLLPFHFTLTQLQSVYEIILGRNLDKRNFRKKILGINLLTQIGTSVRGPKHRPAQLYRFTSPSLQTIEIL